MGEIRSQDKRDKLRLINAQRGTSKKPLKDLLMDALTECDAAISSGGSAPGTWLSSTSENGGSVGFSMLYEFSPIVAKRLIGELFDHFETAVAKLDADDSGTDDDAIFTYMMAKLRPIRRFRSDFTGSRYGIGSTGIS